MGTLNLHFILHEVLDTRQDFHLKTFLDLELKQGKTMIMIMYRPLHSVVVPIVYLIDTSEKQTFSMKTTHCNIANYCILNT